MERDRRRMRPRALLRLTAATGTPVVRPQAPALVTSRPTSSARRRPPPRARVRFPGRATPPGAASLGPQVRADMRAPAVWAVVAVITLADARSNAMKYPSWPGSWCVLVGGRRCAHGMRQAGDERARRRLTGALPRAPHNPRSRRRRRRATLWSLRWKRMTGPRCSSCSDPEPSSCSPPAIRYKTGRSETRFSPDIAPSTRSQPAARTIWCCSSVRINGRCRCHSCAKTVAGDSTARPVLMSWCCGASVRTN